MKNKLLVLMISVMGCAASQNNPSQLYFNDATFQIKPHLIIKDGAYFLKYKIKIEGYQTRWELGVKKTDDKAYYYFVGKSSFNEHTKYVEVPIERDGLKEYAVNNNLFWLNPDGTENQIKVIRE